MEVNWKERHDTLAKLATDLNSKLQELSFLKSRIEYHIQESDRLSLRERGKSRFYRLKSPVELEVQYDDYQRPSKDMKFEAGTLVVNPRIYLDDDGDGTLYFPLNILEQVELNDNEVDWTKVVQQR